MAYGASGNKVGLYNIDQSGPRWSGSENDAEVKAFLSRPIEGDWPYLRIDATYVKVRQSGRIVSVAVIVAVVVNAWLCCANGATL